MTGPDPSDPIARLDPFEIEEWAGTTTLTRGRGYQREGRVSGLSRGPGGSIIARVEGADEYTTAVRYRNGLESSCTCPVGISCKHAVAVILEYQSLIGEQREIPELTGGNLLREDYEELFPDQPVFSRCDTVSESGIPVGRGGTKKKEWQESTDTRLRQYLATLPKEELIAILGTLAKEVPAVRQDLSDRLSVANSDATAVYRSLAADINRISRMDAWSNPWNGESSVPDYSPVRKRMQILHSMGKHDDLLKAGDLLLKRGTQQVAESDDNGETAIEIGQCMDLVFSALSGAPGPAHERILYAVHADLDDEYELCAGAAGFLKGTFPGEEWATAADRLMQELRETGPVAGHGVSRSEYRRNRLCDWIVTALDCAGRNNEATDLCIAEVERTNNYSGLSRRLVAAGRMDEAAAWIRQGIRQTMQKSPGIAAELRSILCELLVKEGDLLTVAAIRAGEFLEQPDIRTWRGLEVSARAAGTWDRLEPEVRKYLEQGGFSRKRRGEPYGTGLLFGLLPDSGLFPPLRAPVRKQPFYSLLIGIAMDSNRPAEVLAWYDRYRGASRDELFSHVDEDRVAGFIAGEFPDRSLEIWKEKSRRRACEARPQSYEAVAGYLEKIHRLLKKLDRMDEFAEFLGELRADHARKKRLLAILDDTERSLGRQR
jgi:uncharacterized Zn finger protein